MKIKTDIIIIGGGIVGLTIAYQLKLKFKDLKITILEKELHLGKHSSGRNSGIIHAGIYYKPNTLKAKLCVKGAKRLLNWCEEENIKVLKTGKVISPQDKELDNQLDLLLKRGISNGAEVYLIDEKEFKELVPDGKTSSGRAIWSPNTSVVNPKQILKSLENKLRELGVTFVFGEQIKSVDIASNNILTSRYNIFYGFAFNTAGLYADKVSKLFGVRTDLILLPFKGSYWKLSNRAPFKFKTNLYPVPDLNQPFLGVHVTPSIDGNTYLGPTAIPAFGRENYNYLDNIEPILSFQFVKHLSIQILNNNNGFRRYAMEQGLQGIKTIFLKSAKKLIPNLTLNHLENSNKVGIRPQLYDLKKAKLIDDFCLKKSESSLHVLNAISPAFTASFELADFILSQTDFC